MGEAVWWSGVTTPLLESDNFDISDPELGLTDVLHKIIQPYETGQPVAIWPKALRRSYPLNGLPRPDGRRLPHFLSAAVFCVSNEALDVLEAFETSMRGISALEHDGSPINERIRVVVPPALDAVDRVASGYRLHRKTGEVMRYMTASGLKADDSLVLRSSALDEVPVWVDVGYRGTLFFRDDIKEALVDAGAAEDFEFRRARVVD